MQALDFLDKLLRYDHQDRLTAREAMVIPFLVCQLDYYYYYFFFLFLFGSVWFKKWAGTSSIQSFPQAC
jgi:serine/threonine protein kinase